MSKLHGEVCDLVKKCKILLLDIEGTTTSISFVKDTLYPYFEENVKSYLESHWESKEVKEVTAALRQQATEDQENSVEGLVPIPGEDASKDEQIKGLVDNVIWQTQEDRKDGPLKELQGLIWKVGYENGDIRGHVYDDVLPALELWRSTEERKIYVYSSGSVEAQKLLFQTSIVGDLIPLIEGHFDTDVGAKQEAGSYAAIVHHIGCKPQDILFLTDMLREAQAALEAGVHAILVSREGNAPLPYGAIAFHVLYSFEQLVFTNKRKPESQVEEVPAKVPKTDAQDDVKTTSETEAETAKTNGATATADVMETATAVKKAEDMEVEETPAVAVAATKDAVKMNEVVVETNTATAEVAEITEKDVPMDDAVPNESAVASLNAPIETAVGKPDSTDNVVVRVDTTDNTTTTESVAHKEASTTEVKDEKASSAEVKSSTAEDKVEISQVAESKIEEADVKTVVKIETKVKMVDAATLTENVTKVGSIESKTVDAATETAPVDVLIEKSNSEEASLEQPKMVDTPVVEAIAEIAPAADTTCAETSKDAVLAPATDSKDVETISSNTLNMEATTSTSDVVESKKIETDSAASKTEENNTTGLNIKEDNTVESKPEKSIAVETSKGTEAKVTETSNTSKSDNSTKDESLVVVEAEPVQNGAKAAAEAEKMSVEAVVGEVIDQKDADDAPACEIKPVVEEIEEKTELNETDKMETEATVSVDKVETVTEQTVKEPEKTQGNAVKKATVIDIEIKDITDDKENLVEVTDIIDDVVPIVEEPSQLKEMEELQNAGDVLEKECDEILSKVQDVTSLDYIPVKPLHTIAEEMETENMDSNDIVERILDTEMELSMKPEDIDLNTVQEMNEPKTDTDDRIGKVEPGTEKPIETPEVKGVTNEKMEVSCDVEMVAEVPKENKVEPETDNGVVKETLLKPVEEKMETEEVVEPVTKIESEKKLEAEESSKPEESKTDTEVPISVEPPTESDENVAKLDDNESDKASVAVAEESTQSSSTPDVKMDDAAETKVNGKTNGNAILKQNGDASKDNELESRLSADTVKEKVNGSNGDSVDADNGQGDNKVEAETPDIKVKMVATDEAHTPKEQPVEA